jgi:GT2 family glycosyltransferase/SAM-dependent methyltransferase/glycosyltransferase involved in cell wall biosynthesis
MGTLPAGAVGDSLAQDGSMIAGAEIFARPRDADPVAFCGERLTSAIGGQVEIEHLHRYFVARTLVRDMDVLDVACGEGYGSALLAQVARCVTGLDFDEATAIHARDAFGTGTLCFARGDATALPFADASFDAVVSFETIEHFTAHEAFLREIRRVLRPGGIVVASSPDRDFYSHPGTPPNPFHVRELTRAEFCDLLRAHFAHVAVNLQRPLTGSVLMPDVEGGPSVPSVFERRGDGHVRGAHGLPHAMYVVCLASDLPVAFPPSVYIDSSDLDGPPARLADARAALSASHAARASAEEAFNRRIDALRVELQDARQESRSLEAALLQARNDLAAQAQAHAAHEQALETALTGAQDAALRAEQAHASATTRMAAAHAIALLGAQDEAAEASAAFAELQKRGQNELARLEQALRTVSADLESARQSRERAATQAASAEFRLAAVEGSSVWKATWPLRRLAGKLPRMSRLARRAAQLSWWALTGQLPRRLRRHWARRAAMVAIPPAPAADLPADVAPENIVLPHHPQPVVCVIVPSFGQVDVTASCLAAIAAHPPSTPFEVIVAEDASGDPAAARLRQVANLRLIENERNLGFLLNCNAAAGHTEAEFLMFLNNDTQVQPGWLDSLVDLLRRRPDAAASGSKLIYPDGRLQEAGGIIWDDASGWNYGRLDDPDKPVYNYVREVDYVSGAALLVRRDDFASLGGFDPAFAPAYCEDSDLAFRLRAAGRAVLYQPRSVVVHNEGASHGTDLAAGLKAYQVTNQARLRERWQPELARAHYPNATHVMRARDHARGRRVVLVIDHYVPQPDRDAGSRTMMAFLAALLQAGRVVKFWTENGAYSEGYTEALQDRGIEVLYGPRRGGFAAWIAENGADIDGVLLSRPHVSHGLIGPLRRHSRARLAYYGHDLHGARLRRQAVGAGDPELVRAADAAERMERAIWRLVDVVLYPSALEVQAAQALEPGIQAHAVVPYAFTAFGEPRDPPPGQAILFVAGFGHPPNEDAACWFVSEILPLILAETPAAELWIVGSNPTPRVRALAGNGVTVAANVSDAVLEDFYRRARVAAVPLRYGAGVKLKVVEALAQGLPLVTTPVGAEGCIDLDGVIALADAPAQFAACITTLLADDGAWRGQNRRQITYASQRFSASSMSSSLLEASGL